LAKLEEGKLSLQLAAIDLNELLRGLLESQRGTLQRRRLALEVTVAEEPIMVCADGNLLYRVIDNLLCNATKFSPRNGRISVELTTQGDEVALRIADEGPGVPAEHRQKVFDKFGIVELKRQHLPQFGLGLAFCKMAVEAHGGAIEISDNTPRGAVFSVTLPARARS
jgi:two-component system, sensor histidine kinase and response regulator